MQSDPRTKPQDTNGQPPADEGGSRPQPHGDEHAIPDDLPKVSAGAATLIGIVVVVLFAAIFLLGWLPDRKRKGEARDDAAEAADAKPVVDVTTPKVSNPTFDLVLPGDVRANQSTAIYARATGYLKLPPADIDIGAPVKAGQVIAEISAPEVDAQLEESKAALEQANVVVGRATNEFNFNKATFERYTGLSQTGGVTAQQLDERKSAFNIASSSLKAAQANLMAATATVKRLTELQGFQKVVAPFDGIITARNYDAGAMIYATAGTGKELFRVDQTETLRVYVNVPQTYATDVKQKQEAELLVRNYPGKPFKGVVARSSGAIDVATRTMRIEVAVPNADGALFPGMYGQIRFKVRRDQPPLVLPTALVFGADGMKVAVLEGNKVRFQKVVVGRDFGSEAEIASGLTGGEQVVTNPGERLVDGVEVRVNTPPPAAPRGGQQASAQ